MISQHMYYINNPLFYISHCLVIQVHKRCNTIDVMQYNQQDVIQLMTITANPMYYTVNDGWSTRSRVRVSAPAVDGSVRRRRGHQREVCPV